MQQPNQSPPGCNPYAVNNKGIAHLLLILLLVAGLSVVGMFLFKMVSGGGLDVMGAKVAINETACQLTPVTCVSGFTSQRCNFYQVGYGNREGYKCAGNAEWNKPGCQVTTPNCDSDEQPVGDCSRVLAYGVNQVGYRCVPKPPAACRTSDTCSANTSNPAACCAGYNTVSCGLSPYAPNTGTSCVRNPQPPSACRDTSTCVANTTNPKPCCNGFKTVSCGLSPYAPDTGTSCVRNDSPNSCTPASGACVSTSSFNRCCNGYQVPCNPGGSTVKCVRDEQVPPKPETPAPVACIKNGEWGPSGSACCSNLTSLITGNARYCYEDSKQCAYDTSCGYSANTNCCPGQVRASCGSTNNVKCVAKAAPQNPQGDDDSDGIPNVTDADDDGDSIPDSDEKPVKPGSGGNTNPPMSLITVSGMVKDSAGKGVPGINVNVFLGNGEKPFGNVAATTNASGNYNFRFDRKKINFAVRAVTAGYKPSKTSYTQCNGIYASGYEDCWFSGTDMSGVDFVSTTPGPPAPPLVKLSAPRADIKALSPSNIVTKGTNVDISVFASSQTAGIKKVQLYYNPAYRDNMSMCNDSAVNAVAFPGMEGKWKLIGEKTFDGSQKQLLTTITWNTSNISALSSFGTYYNGTNNPYANKYYIAVNVEDVNTGSDARRCSGNPLGPKACGSNYYHESCGTASWGVVTVNPTGTAVVEPAVTVWAKGSTNSTTPSMMSLLIRDVVVRTWTVTSTSALQTFTYGDISKDKGIQPKDVKVKFINDNGPRDLYVDGIKLYGTYIPSNASTVYVTGFWTSTTKSCSPGFHQTRWMHCNGYFQYGPPVPAY
jgi:hypothetical protein